VSSIAANQLCCPTGLVMRLMGTALPMAVWGRRWLSWWSQVAGLPQGGAEFVAGVAPGVGRVSRAVARQDTFDGDAKCDDAFHHMPGVCGPAQV